MKKSSVKHYIWGWHSIEAALIHRPELLLELYCQKDQRLPDKLFELIKRSDLKLQHVTTIPSDLRDKRHQGLWGVLKYFPLHFLSNDKEHWKEQLAHPGQWLLLDGVEDPRNFGAIIRAAAAFEAKGVFIPHKGQAPLTGVVAQASAGTLFLVPLIVCTNLSYVFYLREDDPPCFWGLDARGKITNLQNQVLPERLVWCLGAEGAGLSEKLRTKCNQLVRLPMSPNVESLNVSMAAGLSLYSYYQRFYNA